MEVESKRKEYIWAVSIAFLGSASMTYLACSSCHDNLERYFKYTLFSFVIWIFLWIGNNEMNDYLSARISWIEKPGKRLVVGFIATVVLTIASSYIVIKGFELLLNFHFTSYIEIIQSCLIITFFISLFFHGRGFLLEWKHSAVAAERYQKESMTATYESLKNQVNPHFLFNSLNALTSLVYEDQDKAAKFIGQLSDVYRYVLDTRSKEVVPIEDELRFMDSYLFLQQIRFGSKLIVKNELESIKGNLPPLALQMLVENAIKHNIVSEEQPLTIKLYAENNKVVVANNLQIKRASIENSAGVGLENIRSRYQFLSDQVVEVEEGDLNFIVKLPILVEGE